MAKRALTIGVNSLLLVLLILGLAWAGPMDEGISLSNKGRYGAAAEVFDKVLLEEPQNAEAARRLAECYESLYISGRSEFRLNAVEAFEKALSLEPDNSAIGLKLARLYAQGDNADKAKKVLKTILQNDSKNKTAMIELGELYSWNPKTFEQAITLCNNALNLDDSLSSAHLILARVYSWKNDIQRSLIHYESFLALNPKNDAARLEYANALSLVGRTKEANAQFDQLSNLPETRDKSILGLAKAYYYSKRYANALKLVDLLLKTDPDNSAVWRLRGMILIDQRMFAEAQTAFKKAVQLAPEDMEAHLHLARTYALSKSDHQKASTIYLTVINNDPGNIKARRELAALYVESSDFEKAIEQYEILYAKHPKDERIQSDLIMAYVKAGDFQTAIEKSETILKTNGSGPKANVLLGEVYLHANEIKLAAKIFKEVLKKQPDSLNALIGLGKVHHLRSLQRIKLIKYYNAILQHKKFAFITRIRKLWAAFLSKWDFNKSINYLTKAAKAYPASVDPLLALAKVYEEHEAFNSAIEFYEKALLIDPQLAKAYMGMAYVYSQIEDHSKSIEAIRKAARINPANQGPLAELVDAYALEQDLDNAIENLEKAIKINPDDLELHQNLAVLYSKSNKFYRKAINECRFILKQEPDNDQIRLLLARVYAANERYDQAVKLYDELLPYFGKDEKLYLEMMTAKAHSSQSKEAISQLQEMLEKDPKNHNARLALANAFHARRELPLAEEQYKILLAVQSNNPEAHLGLGIIYREVKKYDEAVIEYREVLTSNPDSSEAYFGLGVIDRENENYERAVAMQKKVLEYDPDNKYALVELSYNYYLLSRKTISFSGDMGRAWWLTDSSIGGIYGQFGNYPENTVAMTKALSEDPGNCEIRNLLARVYHEYGRNSDAIHQYRKLLQFCPDQINARVALAELYSYSSSTYTSAIVQTIELLKNDPNDFEAHLRLARLYAWTLQYENSINHYQWCLDKKPAAQFIRFELAQTFSYAKKYSDAIAQYEKLLAASPDRDDVRLELARLYSYADTVDQAIHHYEGIINRNPDQYGASLALADLYSLDRKRHEQASFILEKLMVRFPNNLEYALQLGKIQYGRSEYELAEKAFEKALAIKPNHSETHMLLGQVAIGLRKPEQAIEHYKKALDINPENIEAHAKLAETYASNPETWKPAIEHVNKVLAYEPGNEEMRALSARLYSYRQEYPKAIQQYKELLEKDSGDDEYLREYALNLAYDEQHEKAAKLLKRLMEKNPQDVQIRLELGLNYLSLDMYTDAIVNLEYVLEEDPWNIRARRGLARAFKVSGRLNKALREYKRILVINPDDPEARQFISKYKIRYNDLTLLEEWFEYPDKTLFAMGPGGRFVLPEMSSEEQRLRQTTGEEHLKNNRYKRARYQFQRLVEGLPFNIYYRLSLAEIFTYTEMYGSAKKQYEKILELDPGNEQAVVGLAAVRHKAAPTIEEHFQVEGAARFEKSVYSYEGGARFTYRFWEGSEAFVEPSGATHTQQDKTNISRASARLGLKLNLFGEVTIKGQYVYSALDRLDDTHNYGGSLHYNLLDVAWFEGFYNRQDIRQTVTAMEQGIGSDTVGGQIDIRPIYRLLFRGKYQKAWVDGSDLADSNSSDQGDALLGYTFLKGPFLFVGYGYTYLAFVTEQPGEMEVYWAPEQYQQHYLTFDFMHDPLSNLGYHIGITPAYNINKNGQDALGISAFGGIECNAALNHRLGLDVSGSQGIEGNYYEFMTKLMYTYFFNEPSKNGIAN